MGFLTCPGMALTAMVEESDTARTGQSCFLCGIGRTLLSLRLVERRASDPVD